MVVPISAYLTVSAILFAIGGYGLITKRNAMRLVFSIEILIGAANLNFIAFNRFFWPATLGQTFVLFSIALGASEAAVILAVVVVAFRLHRDVDVSELRELEG
jgi:NADH:ubiquinone oxidoreductase subunit K